MTTFKMLRNMFLLLLLVHFSESVCLSSGSTCSNAAGPTGFDCSSSLRMGGNNYCCCNNLRLYCSSSSDCGTTAPTTYGTFSVVVQRATNLPDTDGYYDTIDPRVKVTLTDPDSEALVQTCGETPVIDDTENPTWNYFISCSGCLDKRTKLNLDIYDFEYNYFSSNSASYVGGLIHSSLRTETDSFSWSAGDLDGATLYWRSSFDEGPCTPPSPPPPPPSRSPPPVYTLLPPPRPPSPPPPPSNGITYFREITTTTTSTAPSSSKSSNNVGVAVGAAVGGIVAVAAAIGAAVYFYLKKRRGQKHITAGSNPQA